MTYSVIAECVDERTGKRFYPGDDFDPAPTERQLARLRAAGCLAPEGAPVDPAKAVRDSIGADTLFDRKVAELRDIAKAEKVDLGGATKQADIIAAIRQARATRGSDGLDNLDVEHLRTLATASGVNFDEHTDPTTLAASIRQRQALRLASPDYERDSLQTKPLADQTLAELQATATHEGADVTVATADGAALIAAIEAKRSPSA